MEIMPGYVESFCLPRALDMDIVLVVCGVTGISIQGHPTTVFYRMLLDAV